MPHTQHCAEHCASQLMPHKGPGSLTVMRDGKPCGFMMRSGQMPRSLKGKSSCGTQQGHSNNISSVPCTL